VAHDPLQPIIISNKRTRRRIRRPRRKWPIGRWVWRIGVGGVALTLGAAIVTVLAEPYAMRYRQKQETRDLQNQLAAARAENRALAHQMEQLKSGRGWEIEARRLGYIRKGEIPIQIIYTPAAPESKSSP
jgi:cell division protein FtsB